MLTPKTPLVASVLLTGISTMCSYGLDLAGVAYTFSCPGTCPEIRAGHFEWTYSVVLGPGETIDFGDFLEITSEPEPSDTFHGFEFDLTEFALPWVDSGSPKCDPSAEVCSSKVFCPITFAVCVTSLASHPMLKFEPGKNWVCSLTLPPDPGVLFENVMPNGEVCTPPAPVDVVESHVFLFTPPDQGASSGVYLVPVTGEAVSFILLKSMPNDLSLSSSPKAVLYDRNRNVKLASPAACESNGVVPIVCP